MKQYKLINNITGWVIFIIASFVYLSTIEPTASFWDCGEFISTAFKLEVGHPPGAPFFMILARFFTLFAGHDVTKVAKMVNSMSALASGLTILFLFWTITHLAKKIIVKTNEISTGKIIAIIGSGLVGALAYTFSDTFWFSAVEGEVYGTSSLFTALVFWAILKWENGADEKYANRWLIFIAYLMGLSIGVHLLNLLAIPAIVLVYYYKHHEISTWGTLKALLISFLILAGVMYVVIPGAIKLAAFFELMFVNGFGLPITSGILFYVVLLISLIVWGLYKTYTKKKVVLNTILLIITFLLIGYSSYAMVVIRAGADTPLDENDPDNLFALQYYLNREQYGDRPLLYGQYFNAPVIQTNEGNPSYYASGDRYKKENFRVKYIYDQKFMTLFPRMWSSDEESGHVDAYIQWANLKEKDLFQPRMDEKGNLVRDQQGNVVYDHNNPKKCPTFSQNLKFFWRYQLGFMYFRYFMWNFAGRENDVQGNYKTEINKGNWISGIKFIDELRLGNQDKLPDIILKNKAHNKYYMLPLLLGLVGLIYHYNRHRKDFWVTMALFFMTGIAIVIYLNQSPLQPRERDYAYAGSFYAFAIWIGIGVLAVYELIKKITPETVSACASTIILLAAVPAVMGSENWNDHDRSHRYVARDFAYNYLNSCAKNAILFTNGDNDTFPLWYDQEVEGIRTDVRVVNLSYLGADWYIDQMKQKDYESDPLPISMPSESYHGGNRDFIRVLDMTKDYYSLEQVIEFIKSDDPRKYQLVSPSQKVEYIPTRNFTLAVDTALVKRNGTVSPSEFSKVVPELKWELSPNQSYILKNHMIILDILATNHWKRPVYFAITVSSDNYLNLDKYFQIQGLAYRIVPIESTEGYFGKGGINTDTMYNNMVNKFRWGGVNNPKVYLDENMKGMLNNFRSNFARLAFELINVNKTDRAKKALDKCMVEMPDDILPFNVYSLPLVEAYFRLGNSAKALEIANLIKNHTYNDLDYYSSLGREFDNYLIYEKRVAFYTLQELENIARAYNQSALLTDIGNKIKQYSTALNVGIQ